MRVVPAVPLVAARWPRLPRAGRVSACSPPASGAGPTSMGPPPPPTSASSVTTRYVVLQTASPSRGSVVADSAQASRLIGKDIFDLDDVVIFFLFS